MLYCSELCRAYSCRFIPKFRRKLLSLFSGLKKLVQPDGMLMCFDYIEL